MNYATSYSYDTLDNLTGVTQGSQTRTFAYDSLRRLTSAANPESGTITYGYDNNGNLTSKTDPRTTSGSNWTTAQRVECFRLPLSTSPAIVGCKVAKLDDARRVQTISDYSSPLGLPGSRVSGRLLEMAQAGQSHSQPHSIYEIRLKKRQQAVNK